MALGRDPNVVGVEVLKKNGIDVDQLIKELVTNASVEFTAYYYFTLLRANCTGTVSYTHLTLPTTPYV